MSDPADRPGPDQTAGMVARYREPLMRYFTRRGFGPPICEDLAHDTFLRLFALKRGDRVDNTEAYLFQTAGSVLNDYLRKQKVRKTHAGMVERIYASWFVGENPEHVLEGKQTFARFEKALLELKPRIRDIFLLSRVEGLTYTQIAVRLSVSVRTVEDDMARAVAHFVKRLRDPQWTGASNRSPPSDDLTEEAGAWYARMHSDQVTSEDELAFVEWLDANPKHREAYEEAASMWANVGSLLADPGMRKLTQHLSPPVSAPRQSRRGLLLLGGGGLAAASVGGWFGWRYLFGAETYSTAFGEQRRVALADGSTMTLNTETTVRVALGDNERRIWLDQGQAHFIVASDQSRPFRVFAGNEEVRALGTRFEVRREGDAMKVTLEEGSVAIFREGETQQLSAPPPASRAQAVLVPGQQATVAPENIQIAAVDTQRVLAWRFGQMNLDSEPLSEAIAEINRYNTRQIVLDDPRLGRMPISGLFQTGSPEAFVDAVSRLLPVEVANEDERSIRLREARQQ